MEFLLAKVFHFLYTIGRKELEKGVKPFIRLETKYLFDFHISERRGEFLKGEKMSYKKDKKEIIISVLESRGFVKYPYDDEGETYADLKNRNYFWFKKDGKITIYIFAGDENSDIFSVLSCSLDQLNYIELAVEHNTGSECFLEIEYSKDSRIRPLPSWYKYL